MKIIGLTGGIGSGKSTVLHFFKELGTSVYIADVEAKKLMNSDVELIKNIKILFGDKAYENETLNRNYISSIVFNDQEKLKELNKLVHPKVREHFKKNIQNTKAEILIYEAAILFESGSDKLCDFIITVTADLKDRIDRVVKRDAVSRQEVSDRIQHQLNDDIKIKKSHFVIKNKNLLATKTQVKTIFDLISKLN
jgi:dephospho-CoA kinase